jgi:small subunit ribosomal protein S13
MARVAGVDLPPNKRAEVGLTYIYGIGRSRSSSVLKEANVNLDTRVRDLSEDELSRIRAILEAERSRATCASAFRWTSSA